MNINKTNTTIKAVICDMDGLLLDTEQLAIDCWHKAARQEGFTIPDQTLIDAIGRDVDDSRKIFTAAIEGFDYDYMRRIKNDFMFDDMKSHGTPVKKTVEEGLSLLKASGYKLAVATSTQEDLGSWKLKNANLYDYYDTYIYGDQVGRGKPKPDIFLVAARKLGCDPEQCAVLEDSSAGIQAAKAAHMTAILVPDLKEPDDTMRKNADHICNNVLSACRLIVDKL